MNSLLAVIVRLAETPGSCLPWVAEALEQTNRRDPSRRFGSLWDKCHWQASLAAMTLAAQNSFVLRGMLLFVTSLLGAFLFPTFLFGTQICLSIN